VIPAVIAKNKKIYLEYNNFRKRIFSELAPKESEAILYMLPWLLSINNPAFPGYVGNLKRPFKVFNVDNNREIRKREPRFKRMFDFRGETSLLKFSSDVCWIQGIYTIGSIGTINQTSLSDCDLWICIDKKDYDETARHQLNQKINLIKDWMDANVKMSVYFFVCDMEDIKNCRFGNVASESSGSAQRKILKEEFYRTTVLICGKIPCWWVCYDKSGPVDYNLVVSEYEKGRYGDNDLIDFGNLEAIDSSEYFGAAVWQFNKSLTSPLKSIIKMILLKMLIEAPKEQLLCHRFRESVLGKKNDQMFYDPAVFTMNTIFNYYKDTNDSNLKFLKKCFYLRSEINLSSRKSTLKKKLAGELFERNKIDRDALISLNNFASWDYHSQIEFGTRIFELLSSSYKEITAMLSGVKGEIDEKDLTIIGRKISVCLGTKPLKIPILQKPTDNLNLPKLTIGLKGNSWQVYASKKKPKTFISHPDIVYCLAYMVWNDIYVPGRLSMDPNPTSVSIQEIFNLANKMKQFLGNFDITSINYGSFLEEERITKLLLIVNFEKPPWEKHINDISVVYNNNWGELFARRFDTVPKLKSFLNKFGKNSEGLEISYYIQRNTLYYEKIIERTKRIVSSGIHGLLFDKIK